MEAKDTVLDTVRIYNITGVDLTEVGQWKRLRPILEAQAEISFKAGQEEEAKGDTNAISYTRGVLDGIAKGRRGVVKWVETHEKSTCMDCTCAFAFRIDEWQAKLEEWEVGQCDK